MVEFRFLDILRSLTDGGVEYVLVGGLAAIAQGAPVTTLDADIVPMRTEENLVRLDEVLQALEARFRWRPELTPQRSHTRARGHLQLETKLGYLDVLMYIGTNLEYPDLLESSVTKQISGFPVRVLLLERLIDIKQELGHAKDLAQLPVLRATLALRKAAVDEE